MTVHPRHRLGLAVEVGEPARAALAKVVAPLGAQYPGVRWIDPERWQVEVCEVGAVDEACAHEIDELAAGVAEESPQVVLRLDGGAGVVRGRALFAGIEHSESFAALRETVLARCQKEGIEATCGDVVPYCVIGQVPGGTGVPSALVRSFRGPTVTWTARRLLVVRTRLRLGGVAVEPRSAHPFGQPLAAYS